MKRCKVELSSNPSDKTPRWLVTENSPTAVLIRTNMEDDASSPGAATDATASTATTTRPATPPSSGKKRRRRSKKTAKQAKKSEVTFTAYEQEMIEWACNGFFPCGPRGLWPTSEDQQQVHVVPFEDGSNHESDPDYDDTPKKKSKVMLVHVKKRGE